MTAILERIRVRSDAGALHVQSSAMLLSWVEPDGGRRFSASYSTESTLNIGFAVQDVVTRAEDPVLVSAWDNETDDIFDTI